MSQCGGRHATFALHHFYR